jgi:chromate transport protein ChrA
MDRSTTDVLRRLAWPTYFVAFLLVVITLMDLVSNIWPLRFGDHQWRYGTLGLLAGFLLTPLLGVVFAMVAAAILEHRVTLRVISILISVTAVLLLLAIPLFGLDAIQLRGTVNPEAKTLFDVGVIKAVIRHLTIAIALGWLGWAGFRATKGSGKRKRQPSRLVTRQPQEGSG